MEKNVIHLICLLNVRKIIVAYVQYMLKYHLPLTLLETSPWDKWTIGIIPQEFLMSYT